MTNPIGTGTRNIAINLPVDEKVELGRLAFRAGAKSVGDYLRALLLTGLEIRNPEAANRIWEIRKRYYGAALLVLFLSTLIFEHGDLRRARRNRVEEVREEEVCE